MMVGCWVLISYLQKMMFCCLLPLYGHWQQSPDSVVIVLCGGLTRKCRIFAMHYRNMKFNTASRKLFFLVQRSIAIKKGPKVALRAFGLQEIQAKFLAAKSQSASFSRGMFRQTSSACMQ